MKQTWYITQWKLEWFKTGVAIVGRIYQHPKFKDGEKICISVKAARKYKYLPFHEGALALIHGHKVL